MKSSLSRLAEAAATLTDPGEMEKFLSELLTPTELHDLVLRWELLELLSGGESQRRVSSELGISLCKITRGAKILKRSNSVSARLLARKPQAPRKEGHAGTDLSIKPAHKARR